MRTAVAQGDALPEGGDRVAVRVRDAVETGAFFQIYDILTMRTQPLGNL